MGPEDFCPHLSTDHPVRAEVTIKVLTGPDKGLTAVCDILGSESQTIISTSALGANRSSHPACRFSF
jgi:hypothetical protein